MSAHAGELTLGDRCFDPHLLLPVRPHTVARRGTARGLPPGDVGSGADVVWAGDAGTATAGSPESVVVLGSRGVRRLRSRGYRTRRLLVLPGSTGPRLLVPLGDATVLRAALARAAPRHGWRSRVRDAAALRALGAGAGPPGRTILLGSRAAGPPWPVQAAREADVDMPDRCFAWLGEGDQLQRAVLHVLGRASEPGWVVKVGRVPGARPAFDQDARAAGLLRALPDSVTGAVPRRLCELTVDGLPLSVESRFAGRSLLEVLGSAWTQRRRLAELEPVVSWAHALARHSAVPAEALRDERLRLADQVLPRWTAAGAPADLVERVGAVPGVLQHGDLGTWNVVSDGAGHFGVVDWGSTRAVGMPLWDLVYLLADALPVLARAPRTAQDVLDVFRGRSPLSPLLFAHVRRAVRELALPADSVGPLVTLAWLHHGLSPAVRAAQAREGGAPATGVAAPQSLLAHSWLQDPSLGATWSTWQ